MAAETAGTSLAGALPGLTEWFPFGDRDFVNSVVNDLRELNIREFRTLFSWADWERKGGPEWFDWMVDRLRSINVRVFPSMFYTPIHRARVAPDGARRTNGPPLKLSDYADFVETMTKRYGDTFDWVFLWNEPNWKVYWDWDIDTEYVLFADMARTAAQRLHALGKKVALGGLTPFEPAFLVRMEEYGVLELMDSISFHQSTGSWIDRRRWYGWTTEFRNARALLDGLGRHPEIWLAETGYSTKGSGAELQQRLQSQVKYFDDLRSLPFDRIFWYSARDQKKATPTDDQLHLNIEADDTAYHFGLKDEAGRPKPLYDHWMKLAQRKM